MSNRLHAQLQSFLDRLANDPRSALMFEADADTLRDAMAAVRDNDCLRAELAQAKAELRQVVELLPIGEAKRAIAFAGNVGEYVRAVIDCICTERDAALALLREARR